MLEAPPDVEATHDARETTEAVWVRPADLLDRGASGEASLLPPTMANLNWLACFDDVDAALEAGFTRSVDVVEPRVVSGADGSIVLELGNDESLVLRKGSRD